MSSDIDENTKLLVPLRSNITKIVFLEITLHCFGRKGEVKVDHNFLISFDLE